MQGKLLLGTVGAIAGGIVGAVVWAAITSTTNFQIGYMAIGIGFLAGFAMRKLSGERRPVEGLVAGIAALLGCVLGNLFAVVAAIAQHDHYPLATVLLGLAAHPSAAVDFIRVGFDWMDLLFYAIAAYAAYRTALALPRQAPVPQSGHIPPAPQPPPAAAAPVDQQNA